MIIALWIVIGGLCTLLATAVIIIRIQHHTLRLRAEFIYALIGDQVDHLTEEIPKARKSLSAVVRRLDVGRIRKRVAREE